MENTLGKRIMAQRKRLGLTQDKLAELLGVTAQAVSKWENDQSCPDITMLPRLAELFHTSTDELLGVVKKEEPAESEPVVLEGTVENASPDDDERGFEFNWEPGRRDAILMSALVLVVGILTLLSVLLEWGVSFWNILWPCAILWCGLGTLFKKFSFFGIACTLFGGYFLLENLNITSLNVSWKLIFPILLLLLGFSLLVDAIKKPRHGRWYYRRGAKNAKTQGEGTPKNDISIDEETFTCTMAFGETHRYISMPKLTSGEISCSFGEMTLNLQGCEEFDSNCHISASCSFGELILLVPKSVRVEPYASTAFAGLDFEGIPDTDIKGVIALDASVNFGQITVRYI